MPESNNKRSSRGCLWVFLFGFLAIDLCGFLIVAAGRQDWLLQRLAVGSFLSGAVLGIYVSARKREAWYGFRWALYGLVAMLFATVLGFLVFAQSGGPLPR